MYCLELRLRGGGLVSLRDGAYSRFERSNVVDEFTPTQGLKVRTQSDSFFETIEFYFETTIFDYIAVAGISIEVRRRERGV